MDSASERKEQSLKRLMIYNQLLNDMKRNPPVTIWDKESNFEKEIYSKLKRWEDRHPIIGIVICTILGGILVSLVAGIILEAVRPLL